MPNGNTIKERLTALEVKVKEIAENHLPHIEAKIDRLNWFLVTTLAGVLITLLTIFLKK